MNPNQQKEVALNFLKSFENPSEATLAAMITDDFEFEMMGNLPGVAPMRGKDTVAKGMTATLKGMFPKGLNLTFGTVTAEGPHVAIQAQSNTVAVNGKEVCEPLSLLLQGGFLHQVVIKRDSKTCSPRGASWRYQCIVVTDKGWERANAESRACQKIGPEGLLSPTPSRPGKGGQIPANALILTQVLSHCKCSDSDYSR